MFLHKNWSRSGLVRICFKPANAFLLFLGFRLRLRFCLPHGHSWNSPSSFPNTTQPQPHKGWGDTCHWRVILHPFWGKIFFPVQCLLLFHIYLVMNFQTYLPGDTEERPSHDTNIFFCLTCFLIVCVCDDLFNDSFVFKFIFSLEKPYSLFCSPQCLST